MSDSKIQNKIIYDRARAATLSRDYELAARLYSSLLKNEPHNIELLTALGSIYEKNRQDAQAIPLYKEIIHQDPDNIEALNALGGIYRRLKMYEESIAVLEQALVSDSTNIQVYYNLGFTYKLMGKNSDAIDCFDHVVSENKEDVLAWNHLGTIFDSEKQFQKAINAFTKGLKADPNHPILHLNLAQTYEKTGQDDLAIIEYESALRSKPGWIDAINGLADLLLRKNMTRRAGDFVQQALRLNPGNIKMRNKMGKILLQQTDYDQAQEEYNSVLENDPDNETALSGLADAYELGGKPNEAIRTMKKIEELKPNDSSMLKQYSGILMTANKLNAASQKIKQVWDMNPDDVQTLNLLGQYYICRGNESKALSCFDKIKGIDPEYNQYLRDGARRYRQIGNYEKSQKFCLHYLEENPNDPIGIALLAADYENLNDYVQALKYYQKLSELDDGNVSAEVGVHRAQAAMNGQIVSGDENPLGGIDEFGDGLKDVLDSDIAIPDSDLELVNSEAEESLIDGVEENAEEELDVLENTLSQDNSHEVQEDAASGFDFETLSKDEYEGANVFSPNDYDLDSGEGSGIDDNSLDALVPETDPLAEAEDDDTDNFFQNNPFAGGRPQFRDDKPEQDQMMFEDEDIDDRGYDKGENTVSVDDGNYEDEEESVDDDAFAFEEEPDPKPEKSSQQTKKEEEPAEDFEDAEEEADFDFGNESQNETPKPEHKEEPKADKKSPEPEMHGENRSPDSDPYSYESPYRRPEKNPYAKDNDDFVLNEPEKKNLPLDDYDEIENPNEGSMASDLLEDELNPAIDNDSLLEEGEAIDSEIPELQEIDDEVESSRDEKNPETDENPMEEELPVEEADPFEIQEEDSDFAEPVLDESDDVDTREPALTSRDEQGEGAEPVLEEADDSGFQAPAVTDGEEEALPAEMEDEIESPGDEKSEELLEMPTLDQLAQAENEWVQEEDKDMVEENEEDNLPTNNDWDFNPYDVKKDGEIVEETFSPEIDRHADEIMDDRFEDPFAVEEEIPMEEEKVSDEPARPVEMEEELQEPEENESEIPAVDDLISDSVEEPEVQEAEEPVNVPGSMDETESEVVPELDNPETAAEETGFEFPGEEESLPMVDEIVQQSEQNPEETEEASEEPVFEEEVLEDKQSTIEMLEKLRELSSFLPEEKLQDFKDSRVAFKLENLISRLSGNEGLLQKSEQIREECDVVEESAPEEKNISGVNLLQKVFADINVLAGQVPDQEAAAGLQKDMKNILSRL